LASGENFTIIDVREPEEFVGPLGHVPGAYNIPLRDLNARLSEISMAHAAGTVLVCRTDKRSTKAAEALRAAAVQNVFVLRGGMEEWDRSVGAFDLNQDTAR
jgi:rhodanese-related sulfurtransferase